MSEATPEPTVPETHRQQAAIKADLLTGIVFLILGLTILYLAWDMPRLENRRIHPATIPGLVPGLLGAALAFCGFLLALRNAYVAPLTKQWGGLGAVLVSRDALRVSVLLALVLVYTLGLVGTLPFWLATGLFVFTFIVLFETVLADEKMPLLKSAFWALVQAVIVSGLVTVIFERGFLVRLPGG